MRVLLDTCTFLWLCAEPGKLSEAVESAVRDPANEIYLSSVSCWEIALKYALRKLPLPKSPDVLVPALRETHGISQMLLNEESALHFWRLPALHRDPFDLMLVSQAVVHGLAIATPDGEICQYPIQTLW